MKLVSKHIKRHKENNINALQKSKTLLSAKKKLRGFTLIEMMVVIAILGVLAAIVAPNVLGRAEKAKVTAAQTNIKNLTGAIELYKIDNSTFPSSLNQLVPDYVKEINNDPWNNAYQYSTSAGNYTLFSFGADGVAGGEGNDADIDG